jgi:hypothetical protein
LRRLWTGKCSTQRLSLGRPAKLWWVSWPEGLTLARSAPGVWEQLSYPVDEDLNAYSYVIRGGRQQIVPEEIYLELVAEGFDDPECWVFLDEYTETFLQTVEE